MVLLIKLWILGSAACVSGGWILSAIHQLNLVGYAVYFSILAVFGFIEYEYKWRRRQLMRWVRWNPFRLRRALPVLFLVAAFLAFLGGAIHRPNNYDALSYRFSRVLHWWAAGHWHWITTPNVRMNLSGTGFEWLMMPIFVVTHSDRFFFLINILSYLLLPTLIFLVFVGAGMNRRAAWFWMWLMPAGLCFAMQAGSISNDTMGATYFLAALYFGFEARRTGEVRQLWLSILSAALLTGVKAVNLPLLLPVAWILWPVLKLSLKRLPVTAAVLATAGLISYLPVACLNYHYTGDWAGDPTNEGKMKIVNPLAGILGNSLQLGLQNLEPPFIPLGRSAESWVWDHFPAAMQNMLKVQFPRFVVGFREIPQEESAGLGIAVTAIALIAILVAFTSPKRKAPPSHPVMRKRGLVIGVLGWIALLAFMSKMGSEATSRLVAAYYPVLLLPLLLNPVQSCLVRRPWYQALGLMAGIIALVAIVLTPSRPLWPAKRFFHWAHHRFPANALMARGESVYGAYQSRNRVLMSLSACIPAEVTLIGLTCGGDDEETSLWQPYGRRRVVHLRNGDRNLEPEINWLVVKDQAIGDGSPEAFQRWRQQSGATVVAHKDIIEKAGYGPEPWTVVHFSNAQD